MTAGQAGEIELPVLIGPTDPCFSRGSLDNTQRGTGNWCALSRAHDAGETHFGGSICVWRLLRGERDSKKSNQREQSGGSSSQHQSRPFEPYGNTVYPLV